MFTFNVVKISGQVVEISGQIVTTPTPTTITGAVFAVNASATQFPNSAGVEHKVKLAVSGVIWIGGSAVNSGAGYMVAGDPQNNIGAQVDLDVSNLNKIYGISMTSGTKVGYLTLNT